MPPWKAPEVHRDKAHFPFFCRLRRVRFCQDFEQFFSLRGRQNDRIHIRGAAGKVMRLVDEKNEFAAQARVLFKISAQIDHWVKSIVIIANDDIAKLGKFKLKFIGADTGAVCRL